MAIAATIHNTLGVLFIVTVLASALYGAGCLQGWFYYRKYSERDPWPVKFVVAFVILCDTLQLALLSAAVYNYAVTNHADPLAMTRMEKTVLIELYFAGMIAFVVQHFYCWRIYLVSKSWIIAGCTSLLSWASIILLYVYTIIVYKYENLASLISQQTLCTVLMTFAAATDIVISAVMIIYLQRQKTGFRRTTDMINRMIIFTFNTGLPTSFCALADVVTLNTLPNTFIYMGFFLLMPRFYTNSVLVTLNSREYIRDGSNNDSTRDHESFSLSRMANSTPGARRRFEPSQGKITIQIDTTTTHDKDYGVDEESAKAKSMA